VRNALQMMRVSTSRISRGT